MTCCGHLERRNFFPNQICHIVGCGGTISSMSAGALSPPTRWLSSTRGCRNASTLRPPPWCGGVSHCWLSCPRGVLPRRCLQWPHACIPSLVRRFSPPRPSSAPPRASWSADSASTAMRYCLVGTAAYITIRRRSSLGDALVESLQRAASVETLAPRLLREAPEPFFSSRGLRWPELLLTCSSGS